MSKKTATRILNNLHQPFDWDKALKDAEAALGKAQEHVKKLEFSVGYFRGKVEGHKEGT